MFCLWYLFGKSRTFSDVGSNRGGGRNLTPEKKTDVQDLVEGDPYTRTKNDYSTFGTFLNPTVCLSRRWNSIRIGEGPKPPVSPDFRLKEERSRKFEVLEIRGSHEDVHLVKDLPF